MYKYLSFTLAVALAGCASNTTDPKEIDEYEVNRSFLEGKEIANQNEPTNVEDVTESNRASFERLKSLGQKDSEAQRFSTIGANFSETETVDLAVDGMPMNEYLHHVFGELLGANYVLGQDLKTFTNPVTLNIQEPVSKRRLFELTSRLLQQNGITLEFNENIFFLQRAASNKAKALIGIGRDFDDVPATSGQILQVIPITYGIKVTMERTINQLIDAKITADFQQSALFVLGDRANVLRAIELVKLLDVPANKGKYIGLVSLTYVSVEEFIAQASMLLTNEGLPVGLNNQPNTSISLVPLNNIGSVAVFANSEDILARVRYWVNVLDQPPEGDSQQYFVYNPRFARATDLGQSIGELLSLGNNRRRSVETTQASTGDNAAALQTETVRESTNVVDGNNVSFVVDERSNSIIFRTTGSEYQILYPLLEKLDVLPKQVILEVMIAEVTLSGDFRFGVEFALNQNADFTTSTRGAFLGESGTTGGINLSYVDGDSSVVASFFKQNRYINVLSNPTILVRDGVEASISVGTDIPIQGGTVSDDGVTQANFEYRRTGVEVSVTPTINAQGVVIMNISQDISNEVDESAGAGGNPSIFERSLKTEAVVASGQTVILGGLISENSNNSDTSVPLIGDIPVLGNLFKGKNDSSTKTELVMLVTPKVIYSGDQWEKLMDDFQQGLKTIRIKN